MDRRALGRLRSRARQQPGVKGVVSGRTFAARLGLRCAGVRSAGRGAEGTGRARFGGRIGFDLSVRDCRGVRSLRRRRSRDEVSRQISGSAGDDGSVPRDRLGVRRDSEGFTFCRAGAKSRAARVIGVSECSDDGPGTGARMCTPDRIWSTSSGPAMRAGN